MPGQRIMLFSIHPLGCIPEKVASFQVNLHISDLQSQLGMKVGTERNKQSARQNRDTRKCSADWFSTVGSQLSSWHLNNFIH